ncbi:sugar phosphate isomerase/epimerase family protein [Jiangella asiatica]|uniref:Sugar phosphate isomerase/epimerase n=1 Tax=Jiangella asiatica TaxID=2530372 RepID=A0A4R5DNT3_9ACTN|nr:TIM barrel protein [Jiangella asiatica]TDE15879.1 sugar phosphate isomerase/epimerase [Jiangella asiatica]
MELGVGSYAFRWAVGHPAFRPRVPLTVAGMVDEAGALGCGLLQIADNAELDSMDPDRLRALRDHADARGVRLQVGTSGLTEARLRRQLTVAAELGADIVRVVLDADGVHPSPAECVAILRAVAPDYEAAGVTVAIENHFLTPSDQLVSIVEGSGSRAVGVCLDTANSIMIGEWPAETIALLAPHCVNLHFKDYAVVSDQHGVGGHVVGRTLGEGWLDIPGLLTAVVAADQRLDGRLGVIVEQWLPLQGDETATLDAERAGREANIDAARRILRQNDPARMTP